MPLKLKKLMAIALIAEIAKRETVEEENANEKLREDKRRRIWARKWILRRNHELRGTINLAHIELRIEDTDYFQRFFRMRHDLFDKLVEKVAPYIQRQNTNMRERISPKKRLSDSEVFGY